MLRYREALAAMLKWATRDMGTWNTEDMRAYLAYTRVWNGMGITGYTTVAAWALREAYSLWAGEGLQGHVMDFMAAGPDDGWSCDDQAGS